jgi:predicted DNA-binding protein YlxM (UPF0122 family)
MSIEDNLRIVRLIDTYGVLLTSKKFAVISDYYFENLTLAEIGDNYGISRQAVRDSIAQSIKSLESYEAKLKIVSKEKCVIEKLEKVLSKVVDNTIKQDIEKIISEMRG